jgi:TonB-linked SusC/RagA family outer membrane protein
MLPNGNAAFQTNAALSFDPSVPLLRHDTVTVNTSPKTPNPASWFYKKDKTYTSRIFFSPNLEITMGKNLRANVIFGIDKTSAERDVYSPFQAKLPEAKENNFGGFSNSYNTNYSAETYLSYNQQFNVHKLSLVAGLGYYRAEGLGYGMSIFNFPTEAYANYNLAVSADKDKSLYNSNKYGRNKLSQFTRLNYTLMDKYILGFTARRDGSSVFAEGKKWGIFPGVSAAWILSEEPFLKSNNLISNLKLRAGYGSTGNESVAITGDYAFNKYAPAAGISYYTGSLYRVGVVQTQLGNNKIKWETDVTTNIGLDIGLLNNRLNATVEYYVRTANDLLDFTNLTSTAVLPTIAKNVGSTQSKGFEIEFRGEIIKTEDIGLSTYVTLSHNKSSWLKRNPEVTLGAWIGEKDGINDIYGWKTDGIFKSYQEVQDYTSNGKVLQPGSYPGNVKFIDQNGDGVLDYKDIVNLGSRDPKINFGFGANFRYKNFDLNVNTYGAAGMKTFNGWLIYSDLKNMINPGANESVYIKNSWSSENPNGTIPGVARGIEIGNNPLDQSNKGEAFFGSRSGNDFSMKSSYYFRVKNITFSYTLPKALLFNNKIAQSAKVFIDLQNVQLFTNYVGIDPEMEQNAAPFPIPFTIATGINIVF